MKHAFHITIIAVFFGLILAMPAWAFDGREAYESADGHWIYFGPDASSNWTRQHVMPRKRSLAQSIRQDALRHYEMPRYELAESGEVISFYGEPSAPRAAADMGPVKRKPKASQEEVFELPESGHVIRFAKEATPPAGEAALVARRNDVPSS